MQHPLKIKGMDGRPIGTGSVTLCTKLLLLQVRAIHQECISFWSVTTNHPIIFVFSWMCLHPHISWLEKEITTWSEQCLHSFLHLPHLITASMSVESPNMSITIPILEEHHDLSEMFCEVKAKDLSPYGLYHCALTTCPVPWNEPWKTMSKKPFNKGIFPPSTSSTSIGFFFIEKKLGGLHPCINY